jgi:hypothetical protein
MSLRIAQEFHVERTAQRDTDDDKWSPGEWAALISHYATRQTVGDLHAVDAIKFRADLVKVGALAMAAIQAMEMKSP